MSAKDSETALLLEKLGRVPNLLDLALREVEQRGGDRYAIQDRLASEHRARKRPFLLGSPLRHPGLCHSREHRFGEVQYELVLPHGGGLFGTRERSVKFTEGALHEVREHGASLSAELAKLLRTLP